MWRAFFVLSVLAFVGCAECHELGESGCKRARDCRPWYAHDVTIENDDGELCCGHATRDSVEQASSEDRRFLQCVSENGALPPVITWSRDPDTLRCFQGVYPPEGFERAESSECVPRPAAP